MDYSYSGTEQQPVTLTVANTTEITGLCYSATSQFRTATLLYDLKGLMNHDLDVCGLS